MIRVKPSTSRLVALSFALMPLIIGFDPFVTPFLIRFSSYTLGRMLGLAIVPLWAALSLGGFLIIERLVEREHQVQRSVLVMSGAVLLALATALALEVPSATGVWTNATSGSVEFYRRNDVSTLWGPDTVAELQHLFANDPVVVGTPFTQYQLAGMSSVRVVSVPEQHTPFYFAANGFAQRDSDSWAFVRPGTSEDERKRIAARYGIEYVVFEWPTTEFVLGGNGVELLKGTAQAMMSKPDRYHQVLAIPDRLLVLKVLR
jgi:hypothetical protein